MSDYEAHAVDVECPGCGSTDTELVYEAIYGVGDAEPKHSVLAGGRCRVCDLQFVTGDVIQADADPDA